MKHKIGFIGLGLIGGSIARAVRQYFPDCEIAASRLWLWPLRNPS